MAVEVFSQIKPDSDQQSSTVDGEPTVLDSDKKTRGSDGDEVTITIKGEVNLHTQVDQTNSFASSFNSSNVLEFHRRVFGFLATSIYNHRYCFIILTILIALLGSSFNAFIQFDDDFRSGYSVPDKESKREHDIFLDFMNLSADPSVVILLGESADGGSMLRTAQYQSMRREIAYGLSIQLNCTMLKPNSTELQIQRLQDRMLFSDDLQFAVLDDIVSKDFSFTKLTYPYAEFRGLQVQMARSVYGYKNGSAKMLVYSFAVRGDDPYLVHIRRAQVLWSKRLKESVNGVTKLRLLGDSVVNNEISEGAFAAIPYFIVGSSCMVVLVFIAVYRYHSRILHALFLTLWTVFCPLLAGTCAMGILSLIGVSVNCVMLITPFLVLGVGVDDAFLTIHHWFHSDETTTERKLRSVLIPIGPSLTLTSFTNIAAFLIGSALSAPDLRLFCYSTALAFFLDWALQILLFSTGLLFFNNSTRDSPAVARRGRTFTLLFSYCEWLQKLPVKVFLGVVILVYWGLSIWGGFLMKEDFSPEKTFDSNSFLAKSLAHYEEAYNDHEVIQVFINELPETVEEFKERLGSLANFKYACQNFPTWLDSFEKISAINNQTTMSEYNRALTGYVSQNPYYLQYAQFEKTTFGGQSLKRLAFDLCVSGHGSWLERALLLKDLRISLPHGFTAYVAESPIFEMITSSRMSVLKSVVITVICMTIICSIFVPSKRAAAAAIISVASTTVGVIGGLYVLGADMDIMVLVNVVMAVGMTVDFSAHISYHCFFETTGGTTPANIADAIEAVAIPTALAALTTFICVFPLYFYNVYIYVTFAKTIFLIAFLGFLHSVLVIPFIVAVL